MEGPWCRFRRKAQPVSDIDTGAVDGLKVLDPDGRLEKRTSPRSRSQLLVPLIAELRRCIAGDRLAVAEPGSIE